MPKFHAFIILYICNTIILTDNMQRSISDATIKALSDILLINVSRLRYRVSRLGSDKRLDFHPESFPFSLPVKKRSPGYPPINSLIKSLGSSLKTNIQSKAPGNKPIAYRFGRPTGLRVECPDARFVSLFEQYSLPHQRLEKGWFFPLSMAF